MKEREGRRRRGRRRRSNRDLSFFLEGLVCPLSLGGAPLYIGGEGAALAPPPRRREGAGGWAREAPHTQA